RMTALNFGAEVDEKKYLPVLETLVAELVKKDPKSSEAAFGEAMMLRRKVEAKDADPQAVGAALRDYAKRHFKGPFAIQLYMMHAMKLSAEGKNKEAVAVYKDGVAALKLHPQVETLEERLKQAELFDTVMDLAGPNLDGDKFDVKSLRGKVVLVDFWATWCGPCVAEMPHVKEVYEKLHEKGFEVVGVSLDQSADDLKEFVKEKEIAWPQIFFPADEDKAGWENPLAKKFFVNAIPKTFLLDRDGKIVSMDLRGKEALEEAVLKLLGDQPAPAGN
ncbi:MAG: TlpA family protein disulfide reductase, partial [Planctomycetia bacterium]